MTEAALSFSAFWNGKPSTFPRYEIRFGISPQSGDVVVNVNAPFQNDPPPSGAPGRLENLQEFEVVQLFLCSRVTGTYLNLQIGPYGHYMLTFFMKEADWETQDPTLDLDQPPRIAVDFEAGRWTASLAIPSFYLPEPECDELSITWTVNACASFGQGDARTYLSWCPLTGSEPNFHQLRCFRTVKLSESMDVRTVRLQSVAVRMNSVAPGAYLHHQPFPPQFQHQQPQQPFDARNLKDMLMQEGYDSGPDDEPLVIAPEVKAKADPSVSVVEFARKLRDKLVAQYPAMGELEEKYLRHVQHDTGEFVLLHSKIWKRKGLSYKKRTLILTSSPRLFYLDGRGAYKGAVPWTLTHRIKIRKVDAKKFEIGVPENERIYYMFDGSLGSEVWVDTITEILNAQKDYLRVSRKMG